MANFKTYGKTVVDLSEVSSVKPDPTTNGGVVMTLKGGATIKVGASGKTEKDKLYAQVLKDLGIK